jgi:hypothetical protein
LFVELGFARVRKPLVLLLETLGERHLHDVVRRSARTVASAV